MGRKINKSTQEIKKEGGGYAVMASEDHVFWNHDGQIFHNLIDLAHGLNNMSDETFHYHVNDSKNDFAKWAKEVLNDDRAAALLEAARNRRDAARLMAG